MLRDGLAHPLREVRARAWNIRHRSTDRFASISTLSLLPGDFASETLAVARLGGRRRE
jgi:hypothetical protein